MALVGSLAGFGLADPSSVNGAAPAHITPKPPVPRPRPRPLGRSSARPQTSPGPLGSEDVDALPAVGAGQVFRRPSLFRGKSHGLRPFSLLGGEDLVLMRGPVSSGEAAAVGIGAGSEGEQQQQLGEGRVANHEFGNRRRDSENGAANGSPVVAQPAARRARATTIVASSSPVSLRRAGTVVVGGTRANRDSGLSAERRNSQWVRPGNGRRPSTGAGVQVQVTVMACDVDADDEVIVVESPGGGLGVPATAAHVDLQPRSPTPYPGQRRPTSSSGTSSSGSTSTTVGLSTRIGQLFSFKTRRGSARERGASFGSQHSASVDDDDDASLGIAPFSGLLVHCGPITDSFSRLLEHFDDDDGDLYSNTQPLGEPPAGH